MTKAIVKFDNQENGKIDVYVRGEKEGYLQKADDNGAWVYWFDGPEGDTAVDYETSLEESKQELIDDYTLSDPWSYEKQLEQELEQELEDTFWFE